MSRAFRNNLPLPGEGAAAVLFVGAIGWLGVHGSAFELALMAIVAPGFGFLGVLAGRLLLAVWPGSLRLDQGVAGATLALAVGLMLVPQRLHGEAAAALGAVLSAVALEAALRAFARTKPSWMGRVRLAGALFGLSSFGLAAWSVAGSNVREPRASLALLGARVVELVDPQPPPTPPPVEPSDPPQLRLSSDWSVLLVTADQVRWDSLGVHGNPSAQTPVLDQLAKTGVDFQYAYTASTDELQALLSLATSVHVGEWIEAERMHDLPTIGDAFRVGRRRSRFISSPAMPSAGLAVAERMFAESPKALNEADLLRWVARDGEPQPPSSHTERTPGEFTWVHFRAPDVSPPNGVVGSAPQRQAAWASEVDRRVGALLAAARARSPQTVLVFAATSGTGFGDRRRVYGESTVYEELVRVPLILHTGEQGPAALQAKRPTELVSLVDLAPTLLMLLGPPLLEERQGRVLLDLLANESVSEPSFLSKSTSMSVYGEGSLRLVCSRNVNCSLFDLDADPAQKQDVGRLRTADRTRLLAAMATKRAKVLASAKGEGNSALHESALRARLGIPGALEEVCSSLASSDAGTRKAAARELYDLRDKAALKDLRAAMESESDADVRAALSLALVRLGDGAPLAIELLSEPNSDNARLAALALAESGDNRGADVLLGLWRAAFPKKLGGKRFLDKEVMSVERAREVAAALGGLGRQEVVGELIVALRDPRLTIDVARALAATGEDAARPALANALRSAQGEAVEAIAESLLKLGGGPEMAAPIIELLGRAQPAPEALSYATKAGVLRFVGGPTRDAESKRLQRFATSGVLVDFVVPEAPKGTRTNGRVRVVCRVGAEEGGELRLGKREDQPLQSEKKSAIPSTRPQLDESRSVTMVIPSGEGTTQVFAELPQELGAEPGEQVSFVVYATQGVKVQACALVPVLETTN